MANDTSVDELPQLETVFNQPGLTIDEHVWIQEGYRIIDQCCTGLAIPIPSGTMLVKHEGKYDLVPEQR